jgi:hypothetical protein
MRSPHRGLPDWLRAADLTTAGGRATALEVVWRATVREEIPAEIAAELRKLIAAYGDEHLAGGQAKPVTIERSWKPGAHKPAPVDEPKHIDLAALALGGVQ